MEEGSEPESDEEIQRTPAPPQPPMPPPPPPPSEVPPLPPTPDQVIIKRDYNPKGLYKEDKNRNKYFQMYYQHVENYPISTGV